jgi:hypothetical protein
VASPNLSVVGLAAHYDEVISGYMASEPDDAQVRACHDERARLVRRPGAAM